MTTESALIALCAEIARVLAQRSGDEAWLSVRVERLAGYLPDNDEGMTDADRVAHAVEWAEKDSLEPHHVGG